MAIPDAPRPMSVRDMGDARFETSHTRILGSRAGNQSLVAATAARTVRTTRHLAAGGVLLLVGIGAVLALRGFKSTSPAAELPVQLTDFNDSAVFASLSHDG